MYVCVRVRVRTLELFQSLIVVYSFLNIAPSEPMSFEVRLQPTEHPAMDVTWQPPQRAYGTIRSYKLVYFAPNDARIQSVEEHLNPEQREFQTPTLRT